MPEVRGTLPDRGISPQHRGMRLCNHRVLALLLPVFHQWLLASSHAMAYPAMTPMTPLGAFQPQQPVGLINPLGQPLPQADEIKTQKSPLPKLQMKGGNATVASRTINEWVQKTALMSAARAAPQGEGCLGDILQGGNRGEGMTHASLRFPEVVAVIHKIASTRPNGFSEEPYLSAQLNAARHLPVHKDKNNHGRSWLIAFGRYEGGHLWIESPVGSHAPPTAKCDWQRALRGDFYSVREQWVSFDPQLYHCVEPVTSGDRRSLALFTPRSWKRIPSHSLEQLMELVSFLLSWLRMRKLRRPLCLF